MENASKALLMAGGVLIGVLVISLAVYLFADFGSTSAEINAQNAQKQITAFNSKFTVYQGNNDITIYDIVSLATFAKENNAYYEGAPEYQISVNIQGEHRNIQNTPSGIQDYKDFINWLIEEYFDNTTGQLRKFSCGDNAITYYDNGRVRSITFR